jgi:hypothetical protein
MRIALVAAFLGVSVALALGTSAPLELAERETLDLRFAVRGTQPVDGLAVVAIDERTFSELSPTWPFRRRLHARSTACARPARGRSSTTSSSPSPPTARTTISRSTTRSPARAT